MVVLTRADKWVRTVDRWRQYASPERKDFRVYTEQQQLLDDWSRLYVLTSVKSTGYYLVLHGVAEQL